jgi:hypothetical protein
MTPPATSYKSFSVIGKPFDQAKPDERRKLQDQEKHPDVKSRAGSPA